MKRFLLFAGVEYYADGGWNDFRGAFDAEADARAEGERLIAITRHEYEWWHIADTVSGLIVACEGQPYGIDERARQNYAPGVAP